jgi:uncharacterized membrane protein
MSSRVTDLRLVVGLVMAATLVLLVPGVPWQVEWMFGFPLLLLLPGYAAVAALFPERPGASAEGPGTPDWPARFGLSLVGSTIVVAVVGILFASQGLVRLTLAPAVLSIGALTLLAVGIAQVRRKPLRRDRHADPVAGASGFAAGTFGTSGAQSLVLGLSVVLLVSTLAFAGTSPAEDPYSEVYLTGGDGVGPTNEYQTMVAGEDNTISLTVENHEGEPTTYTVVVTMERMDGSADGTNASGGSADGANASDGTTVELHRYEATVEPGQRWTRRHEIEPAVAGERVRVHYYLYRGDAPATPDASSAYRHLWLSVSNGDA